MEEWNMSENEELIEAVLDFANAMEAASVALKHRISKTVSPTATIAAEMYPTTLLSKLSWEDRTGSRLGSFQVAKKTSDPVYDNCIKLLGKTSINNRMKIAGMSYWLYGETMYRKKMGR